MSGIRFLLTYWHYSTSCFASNGRGGRKNQAKTTMCRTFHKMSISSKRDSSHLSVRCAAGEGGVAEAFRERRHQDQSLSCLWTLNRRFLSGPRGLP